jgi:hypothetical protein
MMLLATRCQLQHIVHTVRQMETEETLRRLMQHIQTFSKTHFYNKVLTSKNFSKPLEDPPPPPPHLLPCVQYIDPEVPSVWSSEDDSILQNWFEPVQTEPY